MRVSCESPVLYMRLEYDTHVWLTGMHEPLSHVCKLSTSIANIVLRVYIDMKCFHIHLDYKEFGKQSL